MKFATISEQFESAVAEIDVEAAVFTTYALEIDFFETEVVPLLFGEKSTLSNDIRIKELQVRELLERSKIKIDLFYDQKLFEIGKESGTRSVPGMEYGFYGVNTGMGVFHPKTVMILGKDRSGIQQLVLMAGSCNLTKAGWWDNIETMKSIMISNEVRPSRQIYDASVHLVDYLSSSNILTQNTKNTGAIGKIKTFVEDLEVAEEVTDNVFFYASQKPFPAFLEESLGKGYKTRQIVSPYFAEKPEPRWLEEIHAGEALVFLPVVIEEEKVTALCEPEFYSGAKKSGVQWSRFSKSLYEKLDKEHKRFLHAKLFEFVDADGNHWAFAGSVNFSHKAFYENIEAGFLFRVDEEIELLETLDEDPTAFDEKQLLPEQPLASQNDTVEEKECAPALLFDWKSEKGRKKLHLFEPLPKNEAKLLDQSGHLLLVLEPSKVQYEIDESSSIVEHLSKNGFVVFDNGECSKNIYILQKNWVFKPLYYPDLSPREILDIYTTMDRDKRDRYLLGAVIKEITRDGEANEYTYSIDEIRKSPDFFSAYAELFYAFRHLEDRIKASDEEKAYYLLSPKPDSLPSLIERAVADETLDNVMKCLILLSCRELYNRYAGEESFAKYDDHLERIKDAFDDKNFIAWFEEEFERQYSLKGTNDA